MSVDAQFRQIKQAVEQKFQEIMKSRMGTTQIDVMDAIHRWAQGNPLFADCSGEFYGDSDNNRKSYFRLVLSVTHNPTHRTLDVVMNTELHGRIRIKFDSEVI